jgi:hypothetical protein
MDLPLYRLEYCSKKGGEKMATKRYLMIDVDEEACKNGYEDVLRDLITMPEVQSIERLDGIFDLMVEVECPVAVGHAAADDLLAKGWVKRFQVLQVEPAEPSEVITPPALDVTKRV